MASLAVPHALRFCKKNEAFVNSKRTFMHLTKEKTNIRLTDTCMFGSSALPTQITATAAKEPNL